MMFREQAEKCRRQANEFAGRPEAPFLLRVANVFEELETKRGAPAIAAVERGKAPKNRPTVAA